VIFLTVGTQLAFDRLVKSVDQWAELNPRVQVCAQIGPGDYLPKHLTYSDFLKPGELRSKMEAADLIVAHAGMGTIISALQLQKPLVVLPRRAALGEHRNDHQLATARWLGEKHGIKVAWSESELADLLDGRSAIPPGIQLQGHAEGPLIQKLASVINEA